MKALIIDTETTGLPKSYTASIQDNDNWPYIVQIAWILFDFDEHKIISFQNHIIKLRNNMKIPEESTKIHRITNERMEKEGKDISVVFDKFIKSFNNCQYIVSHNLDFDWKVLSVEFYRNKLFHMIDLNKNKKIRYCTMKYAKELYRFRNKNGKLTKKYPKLIDLYKLFFHEEPKNLHDASVDTYACFRCFHKMITGNDFNRGGINGSPSTFKKS